MLRWLAASVLRYCLRRMRGGCLFDWGFPAEEHPLAWAGDSEVVAAADVLLGGVLPWPAACATSRRQKQEAAEDDCKGAERDCKTEAAASTATAEAAREARSSRRNVRKCTRAKLLKRHLGKSFLKNTRSVKPHGHWFKLELFIAQCRVRPSLVFIIS